MRRKALWLVVLALLAVLLVLVGVAFRDAGRPYSGYTLFAPLRSTTTYLIDLQGKVVHTWKSDAYPGNSVYLLENGNLLRTADPGRNGNETFKAGGAGGRMDELDWDGNVIWSYEYSSAEYLQHHDVEKLPNGNVLLIAWERRTAAEAIQAGRNPELLKDGELWPDKIVEVKPTGPNGGTVVWEWRLWDHLVQDFDPTKDNFGAVGEHPELVDLNFIGTQGRNAGGADWTHTNSVDYNEELDQILLSIHGFSEIWVIDHSTTTAEAAGHTGGRSGRGGDLLYRWGNPRAYRAGGPEDQRFFGQHDAEWIAAGLPGAGNILVFNNGLNRPGTKYSTVEELKPPVDRQGNYELARGESYGPQEPAWAFKAEPPSGLYSAYISGAQRLANGNTLICSGGSGRFLEVTPRGKIVWSYENRFSDQPGDGSGDSPIKSSAAFRADRYAADYPGLQGRSLVGSADGS